jgi:L-aminopeptidase/D-esterase-like protein
VITDVAGVRVGHHTDLEGITGCTVVLLPPGSRASCAVIGAAPDSRQTELLRPENTVDEVHAIVLTGGSAWGLGCANGVMDWLADRDIGMRLRDAIVPITPTSVLFDLTIGDPRAYPKPDDARAACDAAMTTFEEGSVGAGTGATVAKWAGPEYRMKGGIGSASKKIGDVVVGAIVACNAVGDIVDERSDPLAAARCEPGTPWLMFERANTVLSVVATNSQLTKSQCKHIARMGGAGIAQAVRPAHTFGDGDTVFCVSTGEVAADPLNVGAVVADVVADALRRGVRAATGLGGVPGLAG